MRLVYLAVSWLAGISLGLAFDVRALPVFLLFLATIPLGFQLFLAGRSPRPLVLLAVLAGVMLLAWWRVEVAGQSTAPPDILDQQRATVTGRVVDDPEARSRNVRFALAAETIDLGAGPQEASSKVLVYAEPPSSLILSRQPPFFQYGDRMTAEGLLQRPKPFKGFDYPSYLESKGIFGELWARQVTVGVSDQGRASRFRQKGDIHV